MCNTAMTFLLRFANSTANLQSTDYQFSIMTKEIKSLKSKFKFTATTLRETYDV